MQTNNNTEAPQLSMFLADDSATVDMGRRIAKAIGDVALNDPLCIYLVGDLGAGKTTLCRGIVQGFGHSGAVKSPTYTLVEPYELAARNIYHFDLYRLASAEELQFLGLDEYFTSPQRLCLVEWPDRGGDFIPLPDLILTLSDAPTDELSVADGPFVLSRNLVGESKTPMGAKVLTHLSKPLNKLSSE